MVAGDPEILAPRHGEQGLFGCILISALLHAAGVGAAVLLSQRLPLATPQTVSYTVELVASVEPAGTNLIAGGGRSQASPPVAPPEPAMHSMPEPQIEAPVEKEAVAKKIAEPKPAPPPLPPKVDTKPPIDPPAPKVEKPAQPLPDRKPEPVGKPKAELGMKAAARKPEPSKPKPATKPPPAAAARVEQAKPRLPAPDLNSLPQSKAHSSRPVASPSRSLDQQIAAAVERRKLEQQIAEAVDRRAKALQEGSGSGRVGGAGPGAPVSLGQGGGAGGVVEGLEMILYRGQLERRIKESWVWAGEDPSLEAKVLFEITDTGEVVNVRTVSSSGNASYDASAERAVRAASPLPPPPEKYRSLFVHGVEITFRAQDLRS